MPKRNDEGARGEAAQSGMRMASGPRGAGPVPGRAVAAIPWLMLGASLVLTGIGLVFLILASHHPNAPVFDYWAENTVVAVGFSTAGAVITTRGSRRNPVGWIMCTLGLVGGMRLFSAEYAVRALVVAPASLRFGEAFAWITTWIWVPHIGLLVYLALLFPDGRLAGRRMRWVAWLNGGVVAAGVVLAAFAPGPVFGLAAVRNPLGIDGMRNLDELVEALIYLYAIFASASLLVRLRHARGIERQQIKWFVYAASVGAAGALCGYVLSPEPGRSWVAVAGFLLIMSSILGMPIAIGFAILRYRLYDIDQLINRTLVYGLLTTALGVAYAVVVLVLGQLFGDVSAHPPGWIVAAATLAVAALFQPARRRVQDGVDRRFNRRRYDAARTVERFAARLRHEIDLPTLSDELLWVVDQTMQPRTASLWLRPSAELSPTRTPPGEPDGSLGAT